MQIEKLCAEAREFRFASVCVNPVYVSACLKYLEGSTVPVCTVAGFPLGATTTETKIIEATRAISDGAKEIDMVLWIGGLKAGLDSDVERDIRAVCEACQVRGAIVKVILECALLTDEEIRRACRMCASAKANFVKTSTGFGPSGATIEAVRLMSDEVKAAGLGVKAAGGIRSYADAVAMIEAGATRIGASASVSIIREAMQK
jgi:deoxyribose-phosphate aldolase